MRLRRTIDKDDTAKMIRMSFHGRYDIGLPGFGARSSPMGRQLIAPCRIRGLACGIDIFYHRVAYETRFGLLERVIEEAVRLCPYWSITGEE